MHFLEIPVFLGWVLRILWSEVMNNYGVPEICVFLGSETFKFCLVGKLSYWGVTTKYCDVTNAILALEHLPNAM